MIVKIRNLVWFCCAWWFCLCARADFEIESFTRYRIDNFDNNNNGYVKASDEYDAISSVEATTVAQGIEAGIAVESIMNILIFPTRVPFDGPVFNAAFSNATENSYIQSRSLLLERVLRFSSQKTDLPLTEMEVSQIWEVSYGARFHQLDDSYRFLGYGGLFGATNITNAIDNQQIGPHVGVKWSMIQGPWNVSFSGIAQAGLGTTDASQTGAIGMDFNPGALNSPIFVQPNTTNDEDYDEFASYYGEVRAQISRTLTDHLSLNLGCSGYYFGNLKYADDSINWYLPSFGITDNGTEDTFISTAFANLEFRR